MRLVPGAREHAEELVTHVRKAGVARIRTRVDRNPGDLLRCFRGAGFAPGTIIVIKRTV